MNYYLRSLAGHMELARSFHYYKGHWGRISQASYPRVYTTTKHTLRKLPFVIHNCKRDKRLEAGGRVEQRMRRIAKGYALKKETNQETLSITGPRNIYIANSSV